MATFLLVGLHVSSITRSILKTFVLIIFVLSFGARSYSYIRSILIITSFILLINKVSLIYSCFYSEKYTKNVIIIQNFALFFLFFYIKEISNFCRVNFFLKIFYILYEFLYLLMYFLCVFYYFLYYLINSYIFLGILVHFI